MRTQRSYRLLPEVHAETRAAAARADEHVHEFVERALEHELRRARKKHNRGRRFRLAAGSKMGRPSG